VKFSADGRNVYKIKPIKNEYTGIYRPDVNVDMHGEKWGVNDAGPSKFKPKRDLQRYNSNNNQ
jgi:hypothetical protein